MHEYELSSAIVVAWLTRWAKLAPDFPVKPAAQSGGLLSLIACIASWKSFPPNNSIPASVAMPRTRYTQDVHRVLGTYGVPISQPRSTSIDRMKPMLGISLSGCRNPLPSRTPSAAVIRIPRRATASEARSVSSVAAVLFSRGRSLVRWLLTDQQNLQHNF